MVNDEDRFVLVAEFVDTAEAHLAKNFLESEGIPAMIQGDHMNTALVLLINPIKMHVREKDAARAVGLLAEIRAQIELDENWEDQAQGGYVCQSCDEPVPDGHTTCPNCYTPCESIRADAPRRWKPAPQEGVQPSKAPAGVTHRPPEPSIPEPAVSRPGCLGALLALFLLWR